MTRIKGVDTLRGFAIALMVVFHFCYDLRYFGLVDWNVPNGPGWWQFRYVILTLFIFTVGVSLSLAHGRIIRWRGFAWRQAKLFASAVAITMMSLFVFPDSWIYFGILHFIFVASFVCLPFVRIPRIAGVLGVALLGVYQFGLIPSPWPFELFGRHLPGHTQDFVPLFPWLGASLLGVWAGYELRARAANVPHVDVPMMSLMGRYSLPIYLLHQPLLFAGFYAVLFLFDIA